jgi:hypothetical protein
MNHEESQKFMQHKNAMVFVFSSEDFFNLATTEIRVVRLRNPMTWCYDTGIFMEILGNSKVFNGKFT